MNEIDLAQLDCIADEPGGYTAAMADGLACVVCGADYTGSTGWDLPRVVVGRDVENGCQVFACPECCGEV